MGHASLSETIAHTHSVTETLSETLTGESRVAADERRGDISRTV
jgi:hypothetical protein